MLFMELSEWDSSASDSSSHVSEIAFVRCDSFLTPCQQQLAFRLCDIHQQQQVARRRLQDMKKQGLSPDVYTWSAAIAACDRFGAKKTTQTMAAGGGGSTMMTSEGQGALALTFLEEMEEAGVPPNQYRYMM